MFNFGAQGAVAPFPSSEYPASNFFGATSLQPTGAKAENEMAPSDKRNLVIAIIALAIGGYALFHWNYIR